MNEFEFEYHSRVAAEERMLDDLEAVCRDFALSRQLAYRLMLVISEAFGNALVHGNQLNPKKVVKLRLALNESAITADIVDQGSGGLQRLTARQKSTLMDDHGRGIDLIAHYADKVNFSETSEGYLHVSVMFRREDIENKVES